MRQRTLFLTAKAVTGIATYLCWVPKLHIPQSYTENLNTEWSVPQERGHKLRESAAFIASTIIWSGRRAEIL